MPAACLTGERERSSVESGNDGTKKVHARHRPARVDRLALIGPGRRRRDHLATIARWHLG